MAEVITGQGNEIIIIDTATPFIQQVAREAPQYILRALKSAGWWLREEIKAGIKAGAPGGQPYKPRTYVTQARLLDSIRDRGKTKRGEWRRARKLKPKGNPLGRLMQATRYKAYPDSLRVVIGWVTKSAEKLGEKHERGDETEITPRMRRFYFAAGVLLAKGKTRLPLPKRPTIGPEYRENAAKIPGYVEEKIWSYILKDDVGW